MTRLLWIIAFVLSWIGNKPIAGGVADATLAFMIRSGWYNNRDLHGIELSYANLRGANLFGAELHRARFTNCDMRYAILRCARMTEANLHGTVLFCADLDQAVLTDAVFSYCDMRFAYVRQTAISYTGFFKADLRYADFSDSAGEEPDFRKITSDNAPNGIPAGIRILIRKKQEREE